MSAYNPNNLPTEAELEHAWRTLFQRDVTAIADIAMPELARLVSDKITTVEQRERRLARALVVLRAQFEERSVELADARADAVRANAEATANRREMVRLDGELARVNKLINDLRATYEPKKAG